MFTLEQLEAKVKELAQQIEQSAASHHVLLGSKMTWEALLAESKKVAPVVEAIDPGLAPDVAEVEKVADAIEGVVEALDPATGS